MRQRNHSILPNLSPHKVNAMKYFLIILATLLLQQEASAAAYYNPVPNASVAKVQSQNVSVANFYTSNPLGDWFTISGFTSAGNCAKDANSGLVVIEVSNDVSGRRQFNTALTALSLGKTVAVALDDTFRDARNYCIALAFAITQ